MTGEYRIPAPRRRVWEMLNDPDVLAKALPGCESLQKISDTELQARIKAKVGPVSATFAGKVGLTDLDPPAGYTITGEGSGGVAGFVKGAAKVHLLEDGPEATVLKYEAKAEVGGKLAQIGSRLIQGTAKKMADDFFGKFAELAAAPPAAAPAEAPAAAAAVEAPAAPIEAAPRPAAPPPTPAPAPPAGIAGVPWIWIVAAAVVLVILLWTLLGR